MKKQYYILFENKNGENMYHIAYYSSNIDEAMISLKENLQTENDYITRIIEIREMILLDLDYHYLKCKYFFIINKGN